MATLETRLTALAAAIRDKINLMVPRLIPPGGAVNQVLAKTGAGDYAAGWVAPGAAIIGAAVLAVPLGAGLRDYEQVIVDAQVTAASKVRAWLVPSDDNDPDQLDGVQLYALPDAGRLTIGFVAATPQAGNIAVNYEVN